MAELKGQPDAIRFQHEEMDVTCCLEYLWFGSSRLILGEEEAELVQSKCCGLCTDTKRGPYGELGTVDKHSVCCFHGFAAASLMSGPQGQVYQCTGCGCEAEKVNSIVDKLKRRQEMRGDRAKVRLAETTLESLKDLHRKMDVIMANMNIPEQTKMNR